jgi:hypothetical protein
MKTYPFAYALLLLLHSTTDFTALEGEIQAIFCIFLNFAVYSED